ncbi:bifunctional DNA primase/polymerase [Yoonia sp. SDW83-1]|uniref:bifunctional DNA primase/polymerase n=1 Tax=Yoonia sp. SDW83-1 TaxID=3366945 RepID=UPI00398C4F6F
MSPSATENHVNRQVFTDPPVAMMNRLDRAGFQLLAVGRPDDPKAAAYPFKDKSLTLKRAISVCHKNRSGAYGVRLDKHVVIDLDEYDPDQIGFVAERFGQPSVQVATGRGVHAYYRRPYAFDATGTKNVLNDAGVRADVKSGRNQYVIGPQSCRMDGVNYHPLSGDLANDNALPLIADEGHDTEKIQKGDRHQAMVRCAVQEVGCCSSYPELADNLIMRAKLEFEDPQSFASGEIEQIALWAWGKHCRGEISLGTKGHFNVQRCNFIKIGCDPDAVQLYCTLLSAHANRGTFLLNYDAMRKAGLITFSRQRFRTARDRLQNLGLLYRYSWPNPAMKIAANWSLYPRGGALTDLY